jgi:hypothetical protein
VRKKVFGDGGRGQSASSRLLKNYHLMVIQSILKDQVCLKSPFEKGGFRGIYRGLQNPPSPPLEKGGIKAASIMLKNSFFNNLVGVHLNRFQTTQEKS